MSLIGKATLVITLSHGYGMTSDHIPTASMDKCVKAMNEWVKDSGTSDYQITSRTSTSIRGTADKLAEGGRTPGFYLKCLETE